MSRSRDRLRILHVIASSEFGGAERVVTSTIAEHDRDRFEVWVACDGRGPMFEEYRRVASDVWSLPLTDIFSPRSVTALAQLMTRLRIHVVHTHLWTADVLGGLAACIARTPIRVATVHGRYFHPMGDGWLRRGRKKVLSGVYRSTYFSFDRVIAVSRHVAADLTARPGLRLSPEVVAVIHNGVDGSYAVADSSDANRAILGLASAGPLVSAVANFVPIKGHRWLIAAMPYLLERWPDMTLLLAGDGTELSATQSLVAAAGLTPHVRFIGPSAEVPRILSISDAVVVPSLDEGLGMTMLEALALGRPVVASDVGGIREVIEDGRSGLLVPPGDARALADAVDAVLSDRDRAKSMGEAGRARVLAEFRADTMARRIERLYADLARAKGLEETPRVAR